MTPRLQHVPPLARNNGAPPRLPVEEQLNLVDTAVDWALAHGLVMRVPTPGTGTDSQGPRKHLAVQAPFALFPTPFPRDLFEQALALQPHFNALVHGITRDPEYLVAVTRMVGDSDAFTMRLLELYERSLKDPLAFKQSVSLGILRSDYLFDAISSGRRRLLQVELNTIAASFGGLATLTTRLHAFLLRSSRCYSLVSGDPRIDSDLPTADVPANMAAGIAIAHAKYIAATAADNTNQSSPIEVHKESFNSNSNLNSNPEQKQVQTQEKKEDKDKDANVENGEAFVAKATHTQVINGGQPAVTTAETSNIVILIIVQSGERNAFDQRSLEYALLENHGILALRRTLHEIHRDGSLSESTGVLKITTGSGWREISVAYFRAGYGPADYPGPNEWAAREMIERSRAVKCPTIAQQLAGTKKMQQVLALPGQVERYLLREPAAAIRMCFAGLYALDGEGTQDAVQMALSDPSGWVLKPQREGGGNNVYGADIVALLRRLTAPKDRAAYILMERIRAYSTHNLLVRDGQAVNSEVISELGVYGVYVADGNVLVHSAVAGHLLRTKPADANEGGVAAGFAFLDSPMLYDHP